jgi:polyphosphate kinase
VAPHHLRRELHELIEREVAAGPGVGHIRAKMNSLVDPEMIDALYGASQAGVRVDLVVRGICCLRPGVAGLSENIAVRSVVGRFLEHSRVYAFAHGADDGGPAVYIGSADLMPRNLDGRVEVMVPVHAAELVAQLDEMFDLLLAPETLAWALHPDGSWERVPGVEGIDAQQRLLSLTAERARA